MYLTDIKVVVRGGGDLATGIIYRLMQAGFKLIVTELAQPLVERRSVALAEAVHTGKITVENMTAVRAESVEEAIELTEERRMIPVLVDPAGEIIQVWQPHIVVDAVIAKRNVLGTGVKDAPIVIGVGPGFSAGQDVHAVIETKRGHFLGRVIYQGEALPNTGIPGIVEGVGRERVVYAPVAGLFTSERQIGDLISAGQLFGQVDATPVYAAIDGCVRGLIRPGTRVEANVKVGDIDPRNDVNYCYTISDKALSIGGGVVEAVLALINTKKIL